MKQFYILSLLLLLFATAAFSQQKSEFGFVVKAGNFTMPEKQQHENSYMTKTYPAGTSASFGVYTLRRLGGHFGISAELLYNLSLYEENSRYDYEYRGASDGYSYWYNTDINFAVNTLMIPAKVHFSFRKNGRLSLSAGLVPSIILESRVSSIYKDISGSYLAENKKDRVVRRNGTEGVQLLFTAGGQYYLSPQTSVGVDFTGSFSREYTASYPGFIFCGVGAGNIEMYPFWMKSITISLRHSILR